MSQERRKKQQEREGAGRGISIPPNVLVWGTVIILAVAGYGAYWYHQNHRYDAFAQCLTAKQAKMYGLYWCPHCIEQKEKFGASFRNVTYVECAIKGSKEMAPACQLAGVKLFPSWQFSNNPPKEGILSLEELGDKTGCSLP